MATKAAVNSLSAESSPRNAKIKKAKAPKKSAASEKPKSSSSHPTFQQMITDAIVALKERTGSSQYAITKYIEEKHKQLPANFKRLVLNSLKKLVAAGKLVKVKNSFKLPSTRSAAPTAWKLKPATAVTSASKPTSKAAAQASAAGAKRKATQMPKNKVGKVSRTSVNAKSPGKKLAKPAKKVAAKKPKSVKSPTKKAALKEAKK